jgi:hypothetical protein
MKHFRASAIAGVFLTLELLASPVMAAKAPAKAPPKLTCPGGCCDSGLGGPICQFRFNGLLTKEQIQTLQRWHSQNVDTLKQQQPMSK